MSAVTAAMLQVFAAAVVAGVAIPAVSYAMGVDRILRHPLQSLENAIAWLVLVRLPKPRKRPFRIYYKGRHRK